MGSDRVYRIATYGAVTATTTATVLTSDAVADTKGAYVQLSAATDFAASGIRVFINKTSLPDDFMIDIAIGAAASEQVIIPDLHFGQNRAANAAHSIFIPIRIPAGVRLSARCQDTAGSNTIAVMVQLHSATQTLAFNRVAAHGNALSIPTTVDPGGTANAIGAWTQFTASTSFGYAGLILHFGNNLNSASTACNWMVSVAVGAGGAEQTVLSNFLVSCEATYDFITQAWTGFIPIAIPAGSRIAVAAQCTTNDATDRLLQCMVYGVG